jgi:hypothetical protein
MPYNNLYTLAEAAVELDLGLAAVRKAAERGRLASSRFGNMRVVTKREIERYRRENKGNVGQPPKKKPAHGATSRAG